MTLSLAALASFSLPMFANADEKELNGTGTVTVKDSGITTPVDPENPGTPVDPGKGSSTTGPLRIDFVTDLRFGEAKITKTDRKYDSLAQQFYDATEARGFYIQITDNRAGKSGWSLQLKQENQFYNPVIQDMKEQELQGAVLSLDKGWANSASSGKAPTVMRETIAITNIGSAYEIAKAETGSGKGVWLINFGASESNENNQTSTLYPLTTTKGEEILDGKYNKPAMSNSAISLSIPDTTKIYPVQYQTELTWILSELP